MLGQQRDRQEGHIGNRVLEAAGDEGVEAPENRDAFGGVAGHPRRGPDREAHQPVAQDRAGDEFHPGAFILAAATVTISGLLPPSPRRASPPPPATNSTARKPLPTRLPAHETPQHAPSSRRLVRPCSQPCVMNIVCPVKQIRAGKDDQGQRDANEAPMTTGRIDGSTALPTQKMRMMPSPT